MFDYEVVERGLQRNGGGGGDQWREDWATSTARLILVLFSVLFFVEHTLDFASAARLTYKKTLLSASSRNVNAFLYIAPVLAAGYNSISLITSLATSTCI